MKEEELKTIAISEAMIANFFGGIGFVATIWALESFSMPQILFFRFAVVGLIGISWLLYKDRRSLGFFLRLCLLPSIFLLMEILFQIWGLMYTSSTNAGFITVTYVVMIPLIERVFFRKPIGYGHWLWVGVAILGTLMLIEFKFSGGNWGDFLMFLSAFGASLHLLAVDRIGKVQKDLFIINAIQSVWGAFLTLPILLLYPKPLVFTSEWRPWIGLGLITFGTTLLAFYFQMRAQKDLSPSVSSILFLVESPIAAACGFFLLSERLSLLQWAGCLFILISAGGVIRLNLKERVRI